MTNSIVYVSDGDAGGLTKGNLASLVQGQSGQSITIEVRDLGNNLVDLTGYSTITGRKRSSSGDVTALVGTLTLSGTPTVAPQVTWVVDEDDTGESGYFTVIIILSNGVNTLKSFSAKLYIQNDPAVNDTPAAGTVGVTEAQAALLAAIQALTGLVKMTSGSASAILIKLDGTAAPGVNDDSGDGYGIGSIWVDTTNDNAYIATDVTVGAANWEQINGAGAGASDVDDLTTTTGTSSQMLRVAAAGGLEYRTVAQVLADLRDSGALANPDLGVTVQGYDADLAAIAALSPTNDDIIQRKAGAWTNRTMAQLKTDLASDIEYIIIACSDETTALAVGTGKATFRMPFAMTVTGVRASVTTAPTGSTLTVDINDGGTTILSTKLTIDATEKTSTTAATPAVISDTALADDAEITIDIDSVGSTIAGAGLKVTLIGTR